MKTIPHLFTILAALALLASCTIERRLHQPGWHIEWRSQLSSGPTEVNTPDHRTISDEQTSVIRPTPLTVSAENHDYVSTFTVPSAQQETQAAVRPPETQGNRPPADDTLRRKVIVVDESDLPRYRADQHNDGPANPLTTALWVVSGISLALTVAFTLLMLFSFFSFPAVLLLLELPFLLFVRIILAVLIRSRERADPARHRRSRNVMLAVLLPELYLLLAAVVLFILLVFMLGGW